jgi:hypothetical protein
VSDLSPATALSILDQASARAALSRQEHQAVLEAIGVLSAAIARPPADKDQDHA